MAVNTENHAPSLPKLFVDSFAHPFEKSRNVEKIIGRDRPHLTRNLAQVRVQSKQAAAQKTGQQHDPGPGKTKRKIMEHASLALFVLHQRVEPLGSAAQHMANIARGEDNPLRLARS